jgi:hypothetical protein
MIMRYKLGKSVCVFATELDIFRIHTLCNPIILRNHYHSTSRDKGGECSWHWPWDWLAENLRMHPAVDTKRYLWLSAACPLYVCALCLFYAPESQSLSISLSILQ